MIDHYLKYAEFIAGKGQTNSYISSRITKFQQHIKLNITDSSESNVQMIAY